MLKKMTLLGLGLVAGLTMAVTSLPAKAADAVLKPFILSSKAAGTVAEVSAATQAKLEAAGFEIAGTYSPFDGANILVITDAAMQAEAAKNEFGAYGAAQRVSITAVNGEVQVSYTNPVYMQHGYRMEGDLSATAAKMEAALGNQGEFGPEKGLTPAQLKKYHYMFGMEYFDEPSKLATYGSYAEAVAAVEANLASNGHGVSKVARIDVPGREETLFAVGMAGDVATADKFRSDAFIMSEIDFKDLRSTAHLPYEIVVSGDTAYALYARFRIAMNFPDLSMMGKNSFMNIMDSPEAIRKALLAASGGKEVKKTSAFR